MTNEDERRARARQRGRDHINSEAGAVTAEALGALLEAREGEQEANSDEARAAAQGAFLSAQAALGRATGATDVRRRRMAVEALDLPSGARVEAGEFDRIFKDCLDTIETMVSRNKLRRLLSRGFIDDEATFTDAVRLLVDKLFKNPKGLMGALDRVEKKSGVDARKGLDDSIRTSVVLAAGYTAGVEFGPDGNIPFAYWRRAQRRHSREADGWRAKGVKIAPAKAATIRDWCVRVAAPHAENFRKARAEASPSETIQIRHAVSTTEAVDKD
jgi:hypothetical protein